MNFPGWDWPNKCLKTTACNAAPHLQFGNLLDDHNLEQIVEEPTRGNNILDLICTNAPSKVTRSHTIPGISDHDGVYAEFDLQPIRPKQKRRPIPLYKRADWESLRNHMAGVHAEVTSNQASADTERLWCIFKDGLRDGIKTFIPHKLCRNKDSFPWITADIRKLMRKRDKLYAKQKKSKSPSQTTKYKNLKHQIQKETRRAYWEYVENIIRPLDEEKPYEGMKRFWTMIKHARSDSCGVAPLRDHGLLISDAQGKAEILNKQFQSAFTRENPVPPDVKDRPSPYPTAPDISISTEGVQKMLQNLKPHKAAGPDEISPRVLKELAPTIAPTLTIIFEKSLKLGEVPKDWRTANVAPVFKKGQKYVAANYRPISLTCITSKLLEHIVTSHIMHHANQHDILSDFQHGFRQKRSCETQLVQFVADAVNNLHAGVQTDVLVMDFSKAFDKVGHQRLIHKLDFYGIRGSTNQWIGSFLHDRKQTVVVDGESSSYVDVLSGVPQGSVLGPSLFLFYINDINENLQSTVRLFADDTICYLAIKAVKDTHRLQEDLDKLAAWEQLWQMEFHPDKCEVIHITHKRSTIKSVYTLHDHILKEVDAAKYLEYASCVWDPYTQTNIDQLEMVQRRSARFALNRWDRTDSVTQMLSELEWCPLQERRKTSRLIMMFKITQELETVPIER